MNIETYLISVVLKKIISWVTILLQEVFVKSTLEVLWDYQATATNYFGTDS